MLRLLGCQINYHSYIFVSFLQLAAYLGALGPNSFIAGPTLTPADFVLAPLILLLVRVGLPVEKYPNLGAYEK